MRRLQARRASVTLLLIACSLQAGCGMERAQRPNIILVTVDTLRADRLGSYGNPRDATPFIDSLAAQGVRFERAYSASSWTVPSLVSLLTSLNPAVHGVERGLFLSGKVTQQEAIPKGAAVLPEILKANGYATFAVTANEHLAPRFGFDRGFDRYTCLGIATAEDVAAVVARWKDEISNSTPYFVWIHLLDPHAPYTFHASQRDFYGPNAAGIKRFESLTPWALASQQVGKQSPKFRALVSLYEGEVRHTDSQIEKIFTTLRVSDRDLVIFTSDHGEEMLDHGKFGHGESLYEEQIRVPLIMRFPANQAAGNVVEPPVRSIDLLPTILEVAQVESTAGLQGESVIPLIRGSTAPPREVVTSLARVRDTRAKSLTIGKWKFIRDDLDPSRNRLFDLASDPGESIDLHAMGRDRAQSMDDRLRAILSDESERRLVARQIQVPPDQVQQLEALGYGVSSPSVDESQQDTDSRND